MILYRKQSSNQARNPDLAGWTPRVASAAGLCRSEMGTMVVEAIAEDWAWGTTGEDAYARVQEWSSIADGWEVGHDGAPFDPVSLERTACGFRTTVVASLVGGPLAWKAPVVLAPNGSHSFFVRYRHGVPVLTDEQSKAVEFATEIRRLISQDLPPAGDAAELAWAAHFLSLTYHLSPATIDAVGILDTALRGGLILTAAGIPIPDAA